MQLKGPAHQRIVELNYGNNALVQKATVGEKQSQKSTIS
jgi:hypothetical protein